MGIRNLWLILIKMLLSKYFALVLICQDYDHLSSAQTVSKRDACQELLFHHFLVLLVNEFRR